MIENILYFSLGFLVLGLLALMFLPAFWRRAVRLSTRRLEMQLPLSMTEILAERDLLRAEFAVERRRVEQRAEDLGEARARDLAELGRRASHIVALDGQLAESRDESERRAQRLAALGDELSAARAEIGVGFQIAADLEGRLRNTSNELSGLSVEHHELLVLADEFRMSIAGLQTRTFGLEADTAALRDALETARRENLDFVRNLANAEGERDIARSDAASNAARRDQAAAQARDFQERAQELEQAHRSERRARLRAETEIASRASALALAETREGALRDVQAGALQATRARENALLQQIEDVKARNAALEGALEAVRREAAARRDGAPRPANDAGAPGQQPPVDAGEAALLRHAISEIGAKVARLAESRDALAAAPLDSAAE